MLLTSACCPKIFTKTVTYQSAYKRHHSIETALLIVNMDMRQSLDEGRSVHVVLFDMSADFDTVNHGILLNRV